VWANCTSIGKKEVKKLDEGGIKWERITQRGGGAETTEPEHSLKDGDQNLAEYSMSHGPEACGGLKKSDDGKMDHKMETGQTTRCDMPWSILIPRTGTGMGYCATKRKKHVAPLSVGTSVDEGGCVGERIEKGSTGGKGKITFRGERTFSRGVE